MKKLFILLLSTSVLISCSDDFTDIDPVGSLNDASLQNATGVDLPTGAYSVLDGHSNAGGSDWSRAGDNWWMDVLADDAHKVQVMVTKQTYLLWSFTLGILITLTS